MATRNKPPSAPPKGGRSPVIGADSRGNVRIYADVPEEVSTELGVLALRQRKAKKDVIADALTYYCKAMATA